MEAYYNNMSYFDYSNMNYFVYEVNCQILKQDSVRLCLLMQLFGFHNWFSGDFPL